VKGRDGDLFCEGIGGSIIPTYNKLSEGNWADSQVLSPFQTRVPHLAFL